MKTIPASPVIVPGWALLSRLEAAPPEAQAPCGASRHGGLQP